MSYRNDHDAALHRVDALEIELAALRRAHERGNDEATTASPPRRVSPVVAAGLLALVGAGVVISFGLRSLASPREATAAATVAEVADPSLSALRACRQAIAPSPHLDAAMTDPRASTRAQVSSIVATGAGCRELLASTRSWSILDPSVQARLATWSDAEDELVGAITRTVVYYGSDPYSLDGYRSAPQLWREYDRAITARDATLVGLFPAM